jgi:hypothetical protein
MGTAVEMDLEHLVQIWAHMEEVVEVEVLAVPEQPVHRLAIVLLLMADWAYNFLQHLEIQHQGLVLLDLVVETIGLQVVEVVVHLLQEQ